MKVVMQGPPSAKGMKFFTLSDETGFFNLVFTPQIYDQYGRLAEKTAYLCVRGRLQKANEHHSILVYEVFAPMKSNNVLVFEDNDKTSIKEKSANKNTKKAEGKIPKKEAETKELSLVSYPELQKPRRFH